MTDQLRPNTSSSSSSSPASPSSTITAAPSLCTNHCGFYGSDKQDGMCSKCYKAVALKKAEAAAAATTPTLASCNSDSSATPSTHPTPSTSASDSSHSSAAEPLSSSAAAVDDIPVFRSSISASSLPPLAFSDSINIPLTSPEPSPLLAATPAPPAQSPQLATAATTTLSPPLAALSLSATVSPSPAPIALPATASVVSDSGKKRKNRCQQCNIKVGLTYFGCRCDESAKFCAQHRYPHSHSCAFDHKQQQQEKLTKANPLCAHDKLERI